MNTKQTFYWFWAAITLLICLNVVTVFWVVLKVNTFRSTLQNPELFITRRLNLTPQQVQQYRQSRHLLRQQIKPYEDSLQILRRELFSHIKEPAESEDTMNRLLVQMAGQTSQITRLRFRHWQKVRAVCRPDQQAQFDQFINRLEQGISNPGSTSLRERFRKWF